MVKNTTDGAVNFVSRKPTQENEGYLRAECGNYRRFFAEGAISGGLSDELAARVSYSTTQQGEGWQYNRLLGVDVGEVNKWGVQGQLLWTPNENLEALLKVYGGSNNSDTYAREHIATLDRSAFPEPIVPGVFLGTGPICPAVLDGIRDETACVNRMGYSDPDGDPRIIDSRNDMRNEVTSFGTSLTINWTTERGTLTAITGITELDQDIMDGYASSLIILESLFKDRIETVSTELRFASDDSWPVDWVAGIYYATEDFDEHLLQYVDDWFFPFDAIGVEYVQTGHTGAGFAHSKWRASERLEFSIGGRYTHEVKKQKGFNNYTFTNAPGTSFPLPPYEPVFGGGFENYPGTALVVGVDNKETLNKFTGDVAVNYDFTDGVSGYARVSRGVKSGGFNGAISFSVDQAGSYGPEELWAYEVGVKSALLDNTLRLNMAAYYYDWEDFQARTLENRNGVGVVLLTNAGDAEVKGLEAELNWLPRAIEGLSIVAGASLIDAEVVSGNFKGDTLTSTPERMFNGIVRYDAPSTAFGMHPYFQAAYSYQSDVKFTLANNDLNEEDAYSLLDLTLGLLSSNGGMNIAVWAKNLTDETYLVDSADTGLTSFPSTHTYAAPRTYGLSLTYSF